jgi:hypothetical protein
VVISGVVVGTGWVVEPMGEVLVVPDGAAVQAASIMVKTTVIRIIKYLLQMIVSFTIAIISSVRQRLSCIYTLYIIKNKSRHRWPLSSGGVIQN